jgi:hypothetical protein
MYIEKNTKQTLTTTTQALLDGQRFRAMGIRGRDSPRRAKFRHQARQAAAADPGQGGGRGARGRGAAQCAARRQHARAATAADGRGAGRGRRCPRRQGLLGARQHRRRQRGRQCNQRWRWRWRRGDWAAAAPSGSNAHASGTAQAAGPGANRGRHDPVGSVIARVRRRPAVAGGTAARREHNVDRECCAADASCTGRV